MALGNLMSIIDAIQISCDRLIKLTTIKVYIAANISRTIITGHIFCQQRQIGKLPGSFSSLLFIHQNAGKLSKVV